MLFCILFLSIKPINQRTVPIRTLDEGAKKIAFQNFHQANRSTKIRSLFLTSKFIFENLKISSPRRRLISFAGANVRTFSLPPNFQRTFFRFSRFFLPATKIKPQYLFIIVKLLLSAGESSPVKPTQRKATGCLPSLYGLKLHPRYQRSLPAMFRRTIILPLSLRIAANHLLSVKPLRGCGGRRQGRRY